MANKPYPHEELSDPAKLRRIIEYFYRCPQCGGDWALVVDWDPDGVVHSACEKCSWTNEVDLDAHVTEWHGPIPSESAEEGGDELENLRNVGKKRRK